LPSTTPTHHGSSSLQAALRETDWQVGDLEVAEGDARRGILVQHRVLPVGLD